MNKTIEFPLNSQGPFGSVVPIVSIVRHWNQMLIWVTYTFCKVYETSRGRYPKSRRCGAGPGCSSNWGGTNETGPAGPETLAFATVHRLPAHHDTASTGGPARLISRWSPPTTWCPNEIQTRSRTLSLSVISKHVSADFGHHHREEDDTRIVVSRHLNMVTIREFGCRCQCK